ncbi:phage tail protein I [Escherichia coli]|uniref:phage tail protein I n=1 Tax=Escherichia coli TaxID=562 RepID=UPI001992B4DB|nr:phage tail protein I [Escherichia coli]CAD6040061.1 tail protein I [Escherichia coli]CAD6089874.1 tail protein I [Escherichia coli]CAD6121730.1 tail protein I [Escherichia coli]
MMAWKTLLPPSASPAERAQEQATAEQIESLPALPRMVKNPDDCPPVLLPWLAWEYALDFWDPDWTVEQKRQAIKDAAYIHQHRGTVAGMYRGLAVLGCPADITEWWQLEPRGTPYTFRVNLRPDGDLPQQVFDDAERIVTLTKNLRSGFWLHGYVPEVRGREYAGGFAQVCERVTVKPAPPQAEKILLTPSSLSITPDGAVTRVQVSFVPDVVRDRRFSWSLSEPGLLSVAEDGETLCLTPNGTWGSTTLTVIAHDGGLRADTQISVAYPLLARIKIVPTDNHTFLFSSPSSPDGITIDYGDGVESRDFRTDGGTQHGANFYPTRPLVKGQEYTLTIRNAACYFSGNTMLTEVMSLSGDYPVGDQDFNGCERLHTVHAGALDHIRRITAVNSMFYRCVSLRSLPEGLFRCHPGITSFEGMFFGCSGLTTLPPGLFAGQGKATDFQRVFAGSGLKTLPADTFAGCSALTNFASAFESCVALTSLPAGAFDGCCFSNVTSMFKGCRSLACDINALFPDAAYPQLTVLTTVFYGCAALRGKGNVFIEKMTGQPIHSAALQGCVALDDYSELPQSWTTAGAW